MLYFRFASTMQLVCIEPFRHSIYDSTSRPNYSKMKNYHINDIFRVIYPLAHMCMCELFNMMQVIKIAFYFK